MSTLRNTSALGRHVRAPGRCVVHRAADWARRSNSGAVRGVRATANDDTTSSVRRRLRRPNDERTSSRRSRDCTARPIRPREARSSGSNFRSTRLTPASAGARTQRASQSVHVLRPSAYGVARGGTATSSPYDAAARADQRIVDERLFVPMRLVINRSRTPWRGEHRSGNAARRSAGTRCPGRSRSSARRVSPTTQASPAG